MILIADSGSTKTDWGFVEKGTLMAVRNTQGLNPYFMSEADIRTVLADELLASFEPRPRVEACYFYGSGCRPESAPKLQGVLEDFFPAAREIVVEGDLLGAARALLGTQPGVACILGTGSNSCLYDGQAIVRNVPSLGYVLGDEGSGAFMGKRFLNALFKDDAYEALREVFFRETGLSQADILRKVYTEPRPNRFLATIPLFLSRHLQEPLVERFVEVCLGDFLRNNVVHYLEAMPREEMRLGAVGSIAFHFAKQLRHVAERDHGLSFQTILCSPLEGLVGYHGGEASLPS